MPDHLFDFQQACAEFCIRQGRAGLYLDTGLGKTAMQVAWADAVARIKQAYPQVSVHLQQAAGTPADSVRLSVADAPLAERHVWLIHWLQWLRGNSRSAPATLARLQLFMTTIEAQPALRRWRCALPA